MLLAKNLNIYVGFGGANYAYPDVFLSPARVGWEESANKSRGKVARTVPRHRF